MQNRTMVGDLRPGQPVDEVFLIAKCELKTTRSDSLYLDIEFMDRSGRIVGRMWDATEKVYEAFGVDEFVHVKGKVEQYRNELQISVRSLSQPDLKQLRLRDFLPQSERDVNEMESELREIMGQVEDADYRRLVDAFLADEEFCRALRTAPAAILNHHAYLGGLLEHTLSMAHLGLKAAEHYPELRRDILLTGIFFHDVGKTQEIRYTRTFQFTEAGHLIGHLPLGAMMLEEKARTLQDFPEDKLNVVLHMILSHHGAHEYGSPVLPMTPEAFALHYIDNLDAKMRDVGNAIDADRNPRSDFTSYQPRLERRLYKK